MRWWCLVVVLAVVSGCGSDGPDEVVAEETTTTSTTMAEPVATERLVFQPWGVAMASEHLEGECWTTSTALAGRADGFRCMAGNLILDPCVTHPRQATSGVVRCAEDPWTDDVTELRLTSPLPEEDDLPGGPGVWAIELVDGDRCTFLQGASGEVDGRRVNFGCESGRDVLGDLDTSEPLYRALVGDEWVDVAQAWS